MTMNDQVVKIPNKGHYSQLELEERNEHFQEELKVCRKKIEELEAEMVRLTSELRVAEKNELWATREARELRKRLAHFSSES